MLFDILFMLIIAPAVPVIVCIGVKLSVRKPSYKNLAIAFTIALLAAEVVRFFCNASLYDGAITPKADLKFNFMTVLTILCLFATFNQSFRKGCALHSFCCCSCPSCSRSCVRNAISTPSTR